MAVVESNSSGRSRRTAGEIIGIYEYVLGLRRERPLEFDSTTAIAEAYAAGD